MSLTEFTDAQAAARGHNLLLQELREMRERAQLGGFFYPIAAGLAFLVTGSDYVLPAFVITASFLLLAIMRVVIRIPEAPDERQIRQRFVLIWSLVLVTASAWGAFSAWSFVSLPEPGPLVAVLFSGTFGMAFAHSWCMRRLPSAIGIAAVMVPSQVLLWRGVAPGVGLMWAIYMIYMLLVLARSHREYRTRLELEEDLRQQRDLFERQSRIDGLTGLANRREFTDALAAALERARNGNEAALLVLDIDYFKRINDALGHLAGDACLVATARRLQRHFNRPGDVVARLGGEEFGVVLEGTGDAAYSRAESFRRDLESAPVTFDGKQASVTVSIGCGAFDASIYADSDAFYLDVDSALYQAKLAGRNRTQRVERGRPIPPAAALAS